MDKTKFRMIPALYSIDMISVLYMNISNLYIFLYHVNNSHLSLNILSVISIAIHIYSLPLLGNYIKFYFTNKIVNL